jgi:hypothetical protein
MTQPRFFGHYLVSRGIITPAKLVAATEFQNQVNMRLGEYAVERGLLSEWDVKRITAQQLSEDLRFGEVAVQMGLLERSSLSELLNAQRLDHILLGEALVALGYATEGQIARILAEFNREEEERSRKLYTIPPQAPTSSMTQYAVNFFRLTHLLLERVWGLRNKPGDVQINSGTLRLSDWNAFAELSGEKAFQIAIALPNTIAQRWARKVYEREEVTEDNLSAVARQFTSIVCTNFTTSLTDQKVAAEPSGPKETDSIIPMPNGSTALVMPYVTNYGQVIAAVMYEA